MRCTAIAESTGERCRRQAVKGLETCSVHTPAAWNPRLNRPVTISREEVEALLGDGDELVVDYLLVVIWRRLKRIHQSNLGLLSEVERSLPLEDMLVRLVAIRRVLQLTEEAADILEALDLEDAQEQMRRAFKPVPSLAREGDVN